MAVLDEAGAEEEEEEEAVDGDEVDEEAETVALPCCEEA